MIGDDGFKITVKDLRHFLSDVDDDTILCLQDDSYQGNGSYPATELKVTSCSVRSRVGETWDANGKWVGKDEFETKVYPILVIS